MQVELCMIAMKERNNYNRIVMDRVEKQGRKERPEANTIDREWIKEERVEWERFERAIIESAIRAELNIIAIIHNSTCIALSFKSLPFDSFPPSTFPSCLFLYLPSVPFVAPNEASRRPQHMFHNPLSASAAETG
ncbi:hypothetical protein TRVL_02709 [Trypanosoma vivax]|nr:hypothetical protein TRVL_02709 [Trypanosoma vivax]